MNSPDNSDSFELEEDKPTEKKPDKSTMSVKKLILWMILFLAIAAVSVYAVKAQSRELSFSDFLSYIKAANPLYLILALISMICFIIFEGLAVLTICRAVGYGRGFKNGMMYSASDIYFSAITPSASGGQPASMWFMVKDGIPATVALAALVANLVLYTLSIVLIGIVTFIFAPALFLGYSVTSKVLIIVGFCALAALAVLFILILFKGNSVYSLTEKLIRLLAKMKLVKRPEALIGKLEESLLKYKQCAELIAKNRKAILLAFVFNFLQRASQITVTFLAYLSVGGAWDNAASAWFAQSYAVVGSNCMPIPGAMGVSDYLLLDGLNSILPSDAAVRLELLSRSISFYSMVVISGVAILIQYILIMKKKKKGIIIK